MRFGFPDALMMRACLERNATRPGIAVEYSPDCVTGREAFRWFRDL
jgi:hypothetical protein